MLASIFARISGGSPRIPLTAESHASGVVSSMGSTMVVLGVCVVLGTITAVMMMRGASLKATGRADDERSEKTELGKGFSTMRRHAEADSDASYEPRCVKLPPIANTFFRTPPRSCPPLPPPRSCPPPPPRTCHTCHMHAAPTGKAPARRGWRRGWQNLMSHHHDHHPSRPSTRRSDHRGGLPVPV